MGLPHCRQMLYCLSHQGSSLYMEPQKRPLKPVNWAFIPFFSGEEFQAVQEISGPMGILDIHPAWKAFP